MRPQRIVALLLTGLVLFGAAGCIRGREVPNVVGMPYEQAVKTLQDDGFKLGDTLDGFSNNATAGLVARQSPVAGNTVERNGSVTLTVVRPARFPDDSRPCRPDAGSGRERARHALAGQTRGSPRTTAPRSPWEWSSCRRPRPVSRSTRVTP